MKQSLKLKTVNNKNWFLVSSFWTHPLILLHLTLLIKYSILTSIYMAPFVVESIHALHFLQVGQLCGFVVEIIRHMLGAFNWLIRTILFELDAIAMCFYNYLPQTVQRIQPFIFSWLCSTFVVPEVSEGFIFSNVTKILLHCAALVSIFVMKTVQVCRIFLEEEIWRQFLLFLLWEHY